MKALLLFFLVSSAWARDPNQIQVQGNCQLKVTPDRGSVTFTAENQSKDQKEAVNKTNEQIEHLKKKIHTLDLPHLELQNTQYQVLPIREYEKDRYVDKGLRAILSLEVTTSDISRLGQVMAEASKLGVQNVGSLKTFLSLEKSKKEYLNCLDIAAEDARGKAQKLAHKLGFKIGDVMNLIETPTLPRGPVMTMDGGGAGMLKSAMVAPTTIEPGHMDFSTTLQVTFEIK